MEGPDPSSPEVEVSALPLSQSKPDLKATALSVYSSQQLIPTAASRELVGGIEDPTARLLDQSLKQDLVQHCTGEMKQAPNLQIAQCKYAINDLNKLLSP